MMSQDSIVKILDQIRQMMRLCIITPSTPHGLQPLDQMIILSISVQALGLLVASDQDNGF